MDSEDFSADGVLEGELLPARTGEAVPGFANVVSFAQQMPGGRHAIALLSAVERVVVRAVYDHLREVLAIDAPPVVEQAEDESTPQSVLRVLFDRSMYNTPSESRAEIAMVILRSLVPDEARIFAALADGSSYPLMRIAEPGVGSQTTVLDNASTVGRAAGVSLPNLTPLYLTRMLAAELVKIGPEVSDMREDYEQLLSDAGVHAAIAASSRGIRPARVVRLSVCISDFGREVWGATK